MYYEDSKLTLPTGTVVDITAEYYGDPDDSDSCAEDITAVSVTYPDDRSYAFDHPLWDIRNADSAYRALVECGAERPLTAWYAVGVARAQAAVRNARDDLTRWLAELHRFPPLPGGLVPYDFAQRLGDVARRYTLAMQTVAARERLLAEARAAYLAAGGSEVELLLLYGET